MSGMLHTFRRDPLLAVLWVALIVVAALWVAPFVFILFTSLKTTADVMATGAFTPPTEMAWQNYDIAWRRGNFSTTVLNSALVAVIKVPLGLAVSALAAYALARMKGRFNRALLLFVIFGTMIPFQVMLAPLFTLVNSMGLVNTYVGLILPYLAFGIPYQIFILHSFFRGVPRELSEAALIDGAGHFTTFRRVFLPITLPVLAALFILDFVATWNEFAMALVIMQDAGKWTLPLGLMSFQGQFSNDYGQMNAAIVTTVMPAVLVYLIFQRYFVSGLASGAVKG